MQKILLAFTLSTLLTATGYAQVKVGDNPTAINPRSLLELESNNKGLLMPRMTNTQIAAMTGAPTGMLVFSSTDSALYLRRDTGWAVLALGNNSSAATNKWASNENNIYNTNSGNTGIGTNAPLAKLDVTGDTVGIRNSAGWDNLWFTVDGSKATINASGAESGINFRVGSNSSGAYGNGQTFNNVMTLMPTGNVGVGNTSPNASAAVDITATNKGLLVPRYTTSAISAINAPAKGLLIYDSTLNNFYVYSGTAWVAVGDNLGNHTATQPIKLNGNALTNNGGNGLTVDNSGKVTLPAATISSGVGNQFDFLMNNGSGNVGFRKGYSGLGLNFIISLVGVFPSTNRTDAVDPFLGEIMLWPTPNRIPNGWALCNGQLLQVNQYQALFALIGCTYGGNCQTTFALPDLRAAIPIGVGTNPTTGKSYSLGEKVN